MEHEKKKKRKSSVEGSVEFVLLVRLWDCFPYADLMENYKKARIVEQPFPCPYPGLASDTPEVRVKDGSKIRNLMGFAMGRMEPDTCRQILFSGAGPP
ncbi:hypothetical protein COCON_G00009000 [Conger conger]|uniref:Uncharacterized protein n=1 Tax=Conger conger TaxID=82655 RepID=A0A9Q1I8V9_CONCO|nr:hypothetical protein COCON_G00009000 [Conger conger]